MNGLDFAAPAALALVLLAIPLAVAARRRPVPLPVSTLAPLAGARPGWRLRFSRALPALRILAVVLLAIAVAGPRRGDARTLVPGEGIDIVISLDLSSSMLARFGDSNRLTVTKDVVREFIRSRENDRVGLVVFQQDALPLSPPSTDYAALDRMVADLDSGLLPDGTGIGVGLAAALSMLQESTAASRIVILLTDGEHNAPSIRPEDAAALAAALKIRVYTIGIVSESPGERAREIDEDLLREIAAQTGGRYFAASDPGQLADVYDEISSLERSRITREAFDDYDYFAPWFAGAGAALLALELLLAGTLLRRLPA
ncbi:vWA domain-containing protein [Tepidiforma thermophila]|uniref:Ca-activated chloride channel family protein n=1 Tax=Tepidiforma thermophila (strain KCTC 52669 / CGMCC 1.13589 / G233) TaxID=2761530 RepID=A0A2A9HCS8_TEPT2|nr:VWA domain-containing protein [Tepidiforma thermophila]PFG72816.1 Ca-activated chloride channel family protein [Tepidiforma thermophila]